MSSPETLLKGIAQRSKTQALKVLRQTRIFEILYETFTKFQIRQAAGQGNVLPTSRMEVLTKLYLFQSIG